MSEHTSTVGISMEQLQILLANQAEMTKGIVAEAVKAAKEPTAEEAEKKAELRARAERSRKQAIAQQQADQMAKKQRQDGCPHKKENGKWATGGQIVGGRYLMILCQHCQKEWYNVVAHQIMAEFNSGDRTLFGADPTGWSEKQPQPENIIPLNAEELTAV